MRRSSILFLPRRRRLMSTMLSSPWLMLPPGRGSSGDIIYNFYSLAEETKFSFDGGFKFEDGMRFVGSSHGWLALLKDDNLFLTNPISGRRIHLPPIRDFCSLGNPNSGLMKLILSSSPDVDHAWRPVTTLYRGTDLASCSRTYPHWDWISRAPEWLEKILPDTRGRVGRESPSLRLPKVYHDFIYYRPGRTSRSFACAPGFAYDPYDSTLLHVLQYWSYNREVTSVYSPFPEELGTGGCLRVPYLVYAEQLRQLFYVVRFVSDESVGPYKTIYFQVYRVDNKGHGGGLSWVRDGSSLDGLAMFVGINHSFAISAADFPNIRPDSIYFTDANRHSDSIYAGHDIGVFDFRNQSVSPCYYPSHHLQRIDPPPLWFTPAPH